MKTILIASGGTGGHIFPALAVANRLQEEGVTIHWVGSSRPLEQRLVKPFFRLTCLKVESIRGRGRLAWLALPWRLCAAVVHAIKITRQVKPDLVLTFGSFVSGPVGFAAWLLRTPLVIHEQNAIPGMTNRYLSRIATHVLTAFPNSFVPSRKHTLVGNPVRQDLLQLPSPEVRFHGRSGPVRILVIGGSQGSRVLNNAVVQWATQYALADECAIWHQTGTAHYEGVQSGYHDLDLKVRVDEFITDMAEAYAWADVVVSRSGALTVTELMSVGVGSVLVPFSHAVDDHQFLNAQLLVSAGAADVIREQKLSAKTLHQALQPYLDLGDFQRRPEVILDRAQRAYVKRSLRTLDDIVTRLNVCADGVGQGVRHAD